MRVPSRHGHLLRRRRVRHKPKPQPLQHNKRQPLYRISGAGATSASRSSTFQIPEAPMGSPICVPPARLSTTTGPPQHGLRPI